MPRRELLTAAQREALLLPRRGGESAEVLRSECSRPGGRTPTSRRPESTELYAISARFAVLVTQRACKSG
jgi:hypothetical protein